MLDKIQDEELKAKEIQNLSAKEKRDSIEEEIAETEGDITEEISKEKIQQEVDNYIQIENSIFLQISQGFKSNFISSQNVRIGSFQYDIIMKSKDSVNNKDRIIEIKFYKNRMTIENIRVAVTNLIFSCKHYETSFKRHTIAILIIVYTEKEFDETIKKYKREVQQFATETGKLLIVNFFDLEMIANAKALDFMK